MLNPILQMLNKPRTNHIADVVKMVKSNPQEMFNSMMQSNPQFAEFVKANQNKTPQEIAQAYGIDLDAISNFMK